MTKSEKCKHNVAARYCFRCKRPDLAGSVPPTPERSVEEIVEETGLNGYRYFSSRSDEVVFAGEIVIPLAELNRILQSERQKREEMVEGEESRGRQQNRDAFTDKWIEEAVEAERERIRPLVERIRLDVDCIICDCGEKYKDSDLDLAVGELEEALTQLNNPK